MHGLIITGTDTNVGKTWISQLILRALQADGHRCGAYKPVCSGATLRDGKREWSDVELLHAAIDHPVERSLICPQTFAAPLAPNVAARMENREVEEELLQSGLDAWRGRAEFVVVEGAGGLLCPVSEQSLFADLALRFDFPVLIVAANRLGVISHTLLTLSVARSRGLEVAGIVLNDSVGMAAHESGDFQSDLLQENQQQLLSWIPDTPVFRCEFRAGKLQPCNVVAAQICDLRNLFAANSDRS